MHRRWTTCGGRKWRPRRTRTAPPCLTRCAPWTRPSRRHVSGCAATRLPRTPRRRTRRRRRVLQRRLRRGETRCAASAHAWVALSAFAHATLRCTEWRVIHQSCLSPYPHGDAFEVLSGGVAAGAAGNRATLPLSPLRMSGFVCDLADTLRAGTSNPDPNSCCTDRNLSKQSCGAGAAGGRGDRGCDAAAGPRA